MIRELSHTEGVEGEDTDPMLVKRRFIPIELMINKNGQYQTFKKKIPYQVRKVVGLVVTHSVPNHLMLSNRIFIGSGPISILTSS